MILLDKNAIKEVLKEAFVEMMTGVNLVDISKAQDLPEFLTVTEARIFCKIKTDKTFNLKIKKYGIKTYYNELKNNLKCYKKEDIIKVYVAEGSMFNS